MANSNPFKVNDRVYVYPAGWGSINQSGIDTCEIDFDGGPIQKIDWRLSSFTEYDPIKGGLSHDSRLHLKTGWIIDKDFKVKHGYVAGKAKLSGEATKEISNLRKVIEEFANEYGIDTAKITGQPDSDNYVCAKGCFNNGSDTRKEKSRKILERWINRKLQKDDDNKYKNIPSAYEQKALDFVEQKLSEGYNLAEDLVTVEKFGDEVHVSLTFKKG